MKIVAIMGSPRGMKGSTGLLLDALLQGARAAGAEIETFLLGDLDVRPCVSCESCHISGECPIADDFQMIKEAILAADGLVLASPNYIINVTAQMKAVLDRCSGPIHLQAFDGKYAAAVVTSGGGNSEEVGEYMLRALRMTGCTTVGYTGALGWELANPDTRTACLAAATALGGKLADAIRTKQAFPEQAEARQATRDRMRQLIAMRKDEWPYEYAVWASRS